MEWLSNPEIWVAFFTLTALEIVLGIDNIIFISILVSRLPKAEQPRARFFGLALAMVTRILLLLSIAWVMRLTADLFTVFGHGVSGRDLILFFGGLFLLFKSTMEIWHSVEGEEEQSETAGGAVKGGFIGVILQIAVIDIVFSLDSVITAVGLVDNVPVMVAAIIIAVGVMMLAAGTISDFIEKHPTLKILALSFLIVVGTLLVAEAFGAHVPKGYVYFAMAFSLAVEALNIRMRKAMKRKLKEPMKLGKDMPD
jgi:predicted tellurium resistance membrane protein TerC